MSEISVKRKAGTMYVYADGVLIAGIGTSETNAAIPEGIGEMRAFLFVDLERERAAAREALENAERGEFNA